jgi:hypothetical protein
MRPYGEYGRPIAIFEAYREWSDNRLQEADSRADFPEFLFGPVRTALWHAYARVNPQWRRYTAVVPLNDFRERRLRGINGLRGFGYVGDHGEYPGMKRSERLPAVIALDTYGGVYSITRQAILSDDTGELLNRNPGDMGWEAGRFVGETIVALIESNPVAADGVTFFHSSRGNTGVAPLAEDALADAISWMEAQLDDDGNHIMIRANALLVKTARLQMIANRILRSQETGGTQTIASAANAGTNIFDKGTLNSLEGILPADAVIREPFMTDATDWYLFADPADVPSFAVGFLNGNEQPFVGLKDPTVRNALGAGMDPYTYEFDSIDFKVRHDFGVAAVDPRGAFRSVAP